MSIKDKAIKRLLQEDYVSKTVIRNAYGISNDLAIDIFNKAKELEIKKCLIDPRPEKVQPRTVMDITNTNRNMMKKQYIERNQQNEIEMD